MNTQPEKQPRRHFSGAEKVAILKRHLIDKVPISNLCDELQLYPHQVHAWLKEFFENGHLAFANGRANRAAKGAEDAKDKKIEQLEAKLTRKNEVMAELMEMEALSMRWRFRMATDHANPSEAFFQIR
jgi:transposase